jgi:hypothetical protein
LAQSARQQRAQEALLCFGRGAQYSVEQVAAASLRAGTGCTLDVSERGVDAADGQRWLAGRARYRSQCRPPDPDLALR